MRFFILIFWQNFFVDQLLIFLTYCTRYQTILSLFTVVWENCCASFLCETHTEYLKYSVYFHRAWLEHFFLQPGSHGLLVFPKFLVSLCATNFSYLLDIRFLKHFTCNSRIRAHGSHPISTTVESTSPNQKHVLGKSLHLRQCSSFYFQWRKPGNLENY